jgi:hypothetical protein
MGNWLRTERAVFRSLPLVWRERVIRKAGALALCLIVALTFVAVVAAQQISPKTMKDLQQDEYISDLQQGQITDNQEIAALLKSQSAMQNEQQRDEGFVAGAFGILSVLQALGLLRDRHLFRGSLVERSRTEPE